MTGDALTLGAVLSGAMVGGGVLLFVVALRGLPVRPGAAPGKRGREELVRSVTRRGAIAVVVGALVLIVTRWPVAAVGAALLALGWGAAAPVLQSPLRTLVDRLHTRMPMPDALRRFADDLNDPSADLVVGALILNAKLRGPGLRDMLGALSTSARAELDMRRRVEANRRTTRFSVQVVVGVSVGTSLLLAVFNRSYVAPYNDFLGQLVLSIVVGLYALGFLWLRRLARFDIPQRFLGTTAEPTPGVPGEVPATVARWQQGDGVRLRGRHATDGGGTP